MAHALVCGHLIECSNYITGGNFSGFKQLTGKWFDLGYPIAEIEESGEFVVTLQKDRQGLVSVDTCRSQLLYEIQGPLYFNSDVTAVLDEIKMEQVGDNRVRITNVKWHPPPPTTKVGITAHGGYQAEAHYFLCGLDIKEKAQMLEDQVRFLIDTTKFHTFVVRTNGSCPENPRNQDSATVDVRIFAQSKDATALSESNFLRPITNTIMQSYPGSTFAPQVFCYIFP